MVVLTPAERLPRHSAIAHHKTRPLTSTSPHQLHLRLAVARMLPAHRVKLQVPPQVQHRVLLRPRLILQLAMPAPGPALRSRAQLVMLPPVLQVLLPARRKPRLILLLVMQVPVLLVLLRVPPQARLQVLLPARRKPRLILLLVMQVPAPALRSRARLVIPLPVLLALLQVPPQARLLVLLRLHRTHRVKLLVAQQALPLVLLLVKLPVPLKLRRMRLVKLPVAQPALPLVLLPVKLPVPLRPRRMHLVKLLVVQRVLLLVRRLVPLKPRRMHLAKLPAVRPVLLPVLPQAKLLVPQKQRRMHRAKLLVVPPQPHKLVRSNFGGAPDALTPRTSEKKRQPRGWRFLFAESLRKIPMAHEKGQNQRQSGAPMTTENLA